MQLETESACKAVNDPTFEMANEEGIIVKKIVIPKFISKCNQFSQQM